MLSMGFEKLSIFDQEDSYVLDRATICAEWFRLWSLFGFNEHQWISRAVKVEEHTRKFLDQTLINYKEQLFKRKQLLRQSLDDYKDLIDRTGCSQSIERRIFDKLKLKEQEAYIDRKLQDLIVEEGRLLNQRNELETKQRFFCRLLNTTPIELDSNLPSSLKRINESLQNHITMLVELKDLRYSQISSYYIKLNEYSKQLDWIPSSSSTTINNLLEKQFDRCLSANDLHEIESTIQQLEQRVEEQRVCFNSLKNQLIDFYERLHKDNRFILTTLSENINVSTIKRLNEEIKLCQEERMKNGNEYREKLCQQIESLIEKARLNDGEKENVRRLNLMPLTNEVLDAYQLEHERLSQLYRRRRPVLDAFDKWFSFWNEFVHFTKSSTDPGRFHIRGYNAENESRQRKKFQRELPLIEGEFLEILSKHNQPTFFIDNQPIRERFDEIHCQLSISSQPGTVQAKKFGLTPIKCATPVTTPRRIAQTKEPFIVRTALASTARRIINTPSTNSAKRTVNKIPAVTEKASIRIKPRPAPQFDSSPFQPRKNLLVHPSAATGDQSLDFSLLHTRQILHGQIKIMTSTPNCSLIIDKHRHNDHGKTARNLIGQRKSKRRSKRIPLPLLVAQNSDDETILYL